MLYVRMLTVKMVFVYNYVLPFFMERSQDDALYSGEYFVSVYISRTLKSEQ